MNYLNIALVFVIIYIGYLFMTDKKPVMVEEEPVRMEKFSSYNDNDIIVDQILDDISNWDSTYVEKKTLKKNRVKPNLLDVMFHNDYRDVITAFRDIVPTQSQLFNLPNAPVKYTSANKDEAKKILVGFIKNLNMYIKSNVSAVRHASSGWDDAIADPNVESGWDRVQRQLGNKPIHKKPLGPTEVKLISVEKVDKFETEDETKYDCLIVIQKNKAKDQMLVKISFVIDKSGLFNEDNFFKSEKVNLIITVEEIAIEGFLSDNGQDSTTLYENTKEKLFAFDQSMEQNGMTDPKDIQRELLKHHRLREKEMNYRNSLLDEHGRDFHRNLPQVTEFENIKNTRTIFEDMNCKKRDIKWA